VKSVIVLLHVDVVVVIANKTENYLLDNQ